MSDKFYKAFEDQFRGSRELIQDRLKVYLPFIMPILQIYPQAQAIDLGCGRGEWLELLAAKGFNVLGIDFDEEMLESCHQLGLNVKKCDAFKYLESLSDESMMIISAFHVVEHITFERLCNFVEQALRVLKPGGILIMETPNPENIIVATRNFYLDPTHERPIPSMLLNFVTDFAGFKRVKTLGLQEPKELHNKLNISLRDVIAGVSPDYAVVAQKDANPEILSLTEYVFDQEYGLGLEELLNSWDNYFDELKLKVEEMGGKVQQAEIKVQQAVLSAQQAEIKVQNLKEHVENLKQYNQYLENIVDGIYSSKSWKITAPLRKVIQILQFPIIKKIIKNQLKYYISYTQKQPKLKKVLIYILNKFPNLKIRIKNIYSNMAVPTSSNKLDIPCELRQLSPHAWEIYKELQNVVERNKE